MTNNVGHLIYIQLVYIFIYVFIYIYTVFIGQLLQVELNIIIHSEDNTGLMAEKSPSGR